MKLHLFSAALFASASLVSGFVGERAEDPVVTVVTNIRETLDKINHNVDSWEGGYNGVTDLISQGKSFVTQLSQTYIPSDTTTPSDEFKNARLEAVEQLAATTAYSSNIGVDFEKKIRGFLTPLRPGLKSVIRYVGNGLQAVGKKVQDAAPEDKQRLANAFTQIRANIDRVVAAYN